MSWTPTSTQEDTVDIDSTALASSCPGVAHRVSTNSGVPLTIEETLEWTALIQAIEEGDDAAGTILYQRFTSMRGFFATRLPPDESEDRFHDVMLAIIRAIRLGGIREPQRLRAYAWSTAQRILSTRLSSLITEREAASDQDSESICDRGLNPEAAAIRHQNKEVAIRVLAALPEKHREVLIRYYLDGQTRDTIQQEMGLTDNQFRLIKSKAKAALMSRLQRRLGRGTAAKIQ